MFHIQNKMIFMKKRIAHNNINIFHSHENTTQKNPQTHIYIYREREKMEGKVLQENRKKKKINTYIF